MTRLIAAAAVAWLVIGVGGPAAWADDSAPAGVHAAAGKETVPESAEGANALNPVNVEGKNFAGDLTIWTGVVFAVVMLILWKGAWGPISQGLERREHEIAAQIDEAQQKNDEARRLLAEYETKLTAAQEEVRAMIEDGRRKAEEIGRQLVDKARQDAAAEHQRGVQQIESATNAALKELAERSATLAVELAGKIVRTTLRPADHSRLIQEAVAGFSPRANEKN